MRWTAWKPGVNGTGRRRLGAGCYRALYLYSSGYAHSSSDPILESMQFTFGPSMAPAAQIASAALTGTYAMHHAHALLTAGFLERPVKRLRMQPEAMFRRLDAAILRAEAKLSQVQGFVLVD